MQLPYPARRFLSRSAAARVRAAVTRAELGHRAEIQVFLEARFPGDGPITRARDLFHELHLDATREGTGVLLYAAVDDRRAAVWAGPGLHGATAPEFWSVVTEAVAEAAKRGDLEAGLIRALTLLGELARTAAPGADTAGNERPDQVHQR